MRSAPCSTAGLRRLLALLPVASLCLKNAAHDIDEWGSQGASLLKFDYLLGRAFRKHTAKRKSARGKQTLLGHIGVARFSREDGLHFISGVNDSSVSFAMSVRGSFKNDGGKWESPSLNTFLEHILKDLPEDEMARLKKCRPHIRGDDQVEGPRDVFIVILGEYFDRNSLESNMKRFADAGRRILVLGPHSEMSSIQRFKHIYVPMASMDFMDQHQHTPLSLVDREHFPSGPRRTIAYQQYNCVPRREATWDRFCEALNRDKRSCYSLSTCNGRRRLGLKDTEDTGRFVKDRNGVSILRFRHYDFVMAMENRASSIGYITEKITNPLLAGAVPLYSGSDKVSEVFNPETFIDIGPTGDDINPALERMRYLLANATELERMRTVPAVTRKSMKRFFTWHQATWPRYGDGLRKRIVSAVLHLCEE